MGDEIERAHLAPEMRQRLTETAFKAFSKIAARWDLSEEERANILGLSTAAIRQLSLSQGVAVTDDVLVRISHVLAIFKALNTIFSSQVQADGWLRRPNTAALFGGDCALGRMRSGEVDDLMIVRRYLESEF